MKKAFIMQMILMFSLVLLISMVSARVCNENQGSIWTTRNDCGNETQDANQYAIGEKVYINGKDFDCLNYNWTVTGAGGSENSKASCDPDTIVASGLKTINPDGSFCFEAYTIANDDCGVYSVDFGKKNDNYHIDERLATVPEFGVFAGLLTLISAVAVFFVVRRK